MCILWVVCEPIDCMLSLDRRMSIFFFLSLVEVVLFSFSVSMKSLPLKKKKLCIHFWHYYYMTIDPQQEPNMNIHLRRSVESWKLHKKLNNKFWSGGILSAIPPLHVLSNPLENYS